MRALVPLLACLYATAQEPTPAPVPDLVSLLQSASSSYLKADYEAARQSLLKAWDLVQQTPPENPARYDVLKRLTSVRTAAGEFADGDNYLQMAIAWREKTFGADDPKIADDLLVSVGLRRGMKQYGEAMEILTRVVRMHVSASGFDTVSLADDYSRMAQLFMLDGKPVNAAAALGLALEIRTKIAGPLDMSLLPDLDRLGGIQISQREYEKAEGTYRHALVVRETLWGKDDADLLATLDGLAYAIFGQKRFEDAEPIYQRLLALWKKSLGAQADEHPMLAITLDKVAVFYEAWHKYEQANAAEEQANAIRARFLGTGLSQAATLRFEQGDKNAAKGFYERILKALDPPNPLYDDLRTESEGILKSLAPAPAPPRKTKK
ncbi:MAG: tetratricopeptide repeat protein [Acidobacteriia bacterium]|nr:tetratricopeptide repeat protein [Terriglobia bacterium]